jgi:hypothetical protein
MFSDDYTEALFAQAVRDNCQRNLEEDFNNAEPIEYSHNHIAKMEKLIRDDQKRELRSKILTWTRRFVATAAAFVVVASGIFMTVPEVRAAVAGAIQNWTELYTEFTGEPIDAPSKQWKLGYIPEGFVIETVTESEGYYHALYMNNQNQTLRFHYMGIDNSISTNNENAEYRQIVYGNIIYHVFESTDRNSQSSIIWDNGSQMFNLSGDLAVEELLKIAKNVT